MNAIVGTTLQAAVFEASSRAARTWVIAPQLLTEFLVAIHHAMAFLDLCFGWESLATLAHGLVETRVRFLFVRIS
jgi:hypothetical protein